MRLKRIFGEIEYMSYLIMNTPPGFSLLGCRDTDPRSFSKVVNNSCASHADRRSHLHPVQYSIETEGLQLVTSLRNRRVEADGLWGFGVKGDPNESNWKRQMKDRKLHNIAAPTIVAILN